MRKPLSKEDYKFFVNSIKNEAYKGEPELAERLYRLFTPIILEIGDMYGKGREIFGIYVMSMGMDVKDLENVIHYVADKDLKRRIRCEYDEEYVEYGFLAVEDGGRGEEY